MFSLADGCGARQGFRAAIVLLNKQSVMDVAQLIEHNDHDVSQTPWSTATAKLPYSIHSLQLYYSNKCYMAISCQTVYGKQPDFGRFNGFEWGWKGCCFWGFRRRPVVRIKPLIWTSPGGTNYPLICQCRCPGPRKGSADTFSVLLESRSVLWSLCGSYRRVYLPV